MEDKLLEFVERDWLSIKIDEVERNLRLKIIKLKLGLADGSIVIESREDLIEWLNKPEEKTVFGLRALSMHSEEAPQSFLLETAAEETKRKKSNRRRKMRSLKKQSLVSVKRSKLKQPKNFSMRRR